MNTHEPHELWRSGFDRVTALITEVAATDPDALERRVPACPGWTARQLLAHMVGLTHDVLDGDEPDDHNDAWTQAQVDGRGANDAAALLAEWRGLAEPMVAYVRDTDPRPLGDVTIHEHDLRGAFDRPGARDTEAVAAIREQIAGRLAQGLDDGLAPLRLEAPDWSWASGDGEPGVVLRAPGFELFRALSSRRTADELRSWVAAGDVTPYLDAFAVLGPLPERSLGE